LITKLLKHVFLGGGGNRPLSATNKPCHCHGGKTDFRKVLAEAAEGVSVRRLVEIQKKSQKSGSCKTYYVN
jgi:hypothetical protein